MLTRLAAGYDGREVVLGIRPEAVTCRSTARTPGASSMLPVVLTEALGSDLLVHLDVDAPPCVDGRSGPSSPTRSATSRSRG